MNLCHIEVVTSEMDVPLSELEMSRVLEPDNPKDCYAVAVYHGNSKDGLYYETFPLSSFLFSGAPSSCLFFASETGFLTLTGSATMSGSTTSIRKNSKK